MITHPPGFNFSKPPRSVKYHTFLVVLERGPQEVLFEGDLNVTLLREDVNGNHPLRGKRRRVYLSLFRSDASASIEGELFLLHALPDTYPTGISFISTASRALALHEAITLPGPCELKKFL